jgi:hypothetical protein
VRMATQLITPWIVVLAFSVAPGMWARAQAEAKPSPGPCGTPEHRQFDFWLGNWQVRAADGKLVGANRIERALGGCALHESWRGVSGHQGHSYNIYDASRHRWHQTWVDDQGLLLELNGGLVGGRMVLNGETVDSTGRRAEQRITWERLDRGNVRQRWESSGDGGVTWSIVFDGIYSRTGAKP